jgi:hypothetical protein
MSLAAPGPVRESGDLSEGHDWTWQGPTVFWGTGSAMGGRLAVKLVVEGLGADGCVMRHKADDPRGMTTGMYLRP